MIRPVLIDGVKLTLDGREWIVPPLNFRQLKTLLPKLDDLQSASSGFDAAHLDAVTDLVEAALTRNYPDLTRHRIEEMITIADIPKVIAAVLTGSGFDKQVQKNTPGQTDILGE